MAVNSLFSINTSDIHFNLVHYSILQPIKY